MNQYRLISKIGEGTFSEVFKAQSIKNHKLYAIKCMRKKYETIDKVRKLKEIQALGMLIPHQHIVNLIEILYDQPSGKLALVFELMEENLYECLSNRHLNQKKVKVLMYQLLKSIEFIHSKGIFHRDIKPQNVLLNGDTIKLADFGSCKGIYSRPPLTEYISTRWYRAPQCLMSDGFYDFKMDIWGYGCVLYEMVAKDPLFNGVNELDQIHKINKVIGTPPQELVEFFISHSSHMGKDDFSFTKKKGIGFERLLPSAPRDLIDLLYKLLAYDPQERITAKEALKHQYFSDILQHQNRGFRNTTLFPAQSNSKGKHDETPEKNINSIRRKNTKKNNLVEEESPSLPPIHHLRFDVKLNLYGSTAKTHDNVFKKTMGYVHPQKKDESYMIKGKKYEK